VVTRPIVATQSKKQADFNLEQYIAHVVELAQLALLFPEIVVALHQNKARANTAIALVDKLTPVSTVSDIIASQFIYPLGGKLALAIDSTKISSGNLFEMTESAWVQLGECPHFSAYRA
jgi:hypothetical protein